MTAIIEATKLEKTYDSLRVLESIDLRVNKGSIHALVGPNGAGKTTLLKIMAGLVRPAGGTLSILGEPVSTDAGPSMRQRVHYLSPEVNLYPLFQVKDILRYASLLYERWDEARSALLVEAFALPLNKVVRKLSLGMKMKLRITIALSAHAEVLLMDEATNGIDPVTKDHVLDLMLQESANSAVTVLMATHQLGDVERVADTISVLVGGRIASTDNLDSLKEHVHEVHIVQGGRRRSRIMTGGEDAISQQLRDSGLGKFEIRPATLEQWFQATLQKEGVANGRIVLPESPVV